MTHAPAIRVFDGVLADPVAYRAAVLATERRSHVLAPEVVFHGISAPPDRTLPDWIEAHVPGVTVTTSVCRLSPLGQVEPNFLHTDRDMGAWTGILYLNPDPPAGDGTTFWRHRLTDREQSDAASFEARVDEGFEWRDRSLWAPTQTVAAVFNRLLLFPAAAFHSRALYDNYGEGESARLIQICFGEGSL